MGYVAQYSLEGAPTRRARRAAPRPARGPTRRATAPPRGAGRRAACSVARPPRAARGDRPRRRRRRRRCRHARTRRTRCPRPTTVPSSASTSAGTGAPGRHGCGSSGTASSTAVGELEGERGRVGGAAGVGRAPPPRGRCRAGPPGWRGNPASHRRGPPAPLAAPVEHQAETPAQRPLLQVGHRVQVASSRPTVARRQHRGGGVGPESTPAGQVVGRRPQLGGRGERVAGELRLRRAAGRRTGRRSSRGLRRGRRGGGAAQAQRARAAAHAARRPTPRRAGRRRPGRAARTRGWSSATAGCGGEHGLGLGEVGEQGVAGRARAASPTPRRPARAAAPTGGAACGGASAPPCAGTSRWAPDPSSRSSRPSSRACITSAAVNVLVIEPMRYWMSAPASSSAGSARPSSPRSAAPAAASSCTAPRRTTRATTGRRAPLALSGRHLVPQRLRELVGQRGHDGGRPSPGRPGHVTAADHVTVRVEHALVRLRSAVEHEAELPAVLVGRHLRRQPRDRDQGIGVAVASAPTSW